MRATMVAMALALLAAGCAHSPATDGAPTSGEVHSTEGTIESFGEGRRFVRIHHETIPGYMQSMTMPFEPLRMEMFSGLAVGDRVAFQFQERDDGRRVLLDIRKR